MLYAISCHIVLCWNKSPLYCPHKTATSPECPVLCYQFASELNSSESMFTQSTQAGLPQIMVREWNNIGINNGLRWVGVLKLHFLMEHINRKLEPFFAIWLLTINQHWVRQWLSIHNKSNSYMLMGSYKQYKSALVQVREKAEQIFHISAKCQHKISLCNFSKSHPFTQYQPKLV